MRNGMLSVVAVFALGCAKSADSTAGRTASAGNDGAVVTTDTCEGPVGLCASTLTRQLAEKGDGCGQWGACGLYTVWKQGGFSSLECVYDPPSGALVSSKLCDDTRNHCGGTAFCIHEGETVRLPENCELRASCDDSDPDAALD